MDQTPPVSMNVPQHGVGQQASDTPVAVEERVNPQQAVMRGGGSQDRVGFAKIAVDSFEPVQETRHRARTHRDVPADLHMSFA